MYWVKEIFIGLMKRTKVHIQEEKILQIMEDGEEPDEEDLKSPDKSLKNIPENTLKLLESINKYLHLH